MKYTNLALLVHVPSLVFIWANQCNITLFTRLCPANETAWKKRGNEFQCDITRDFTYHCILNDKGLLKEACIKKQIIDQGKGGCPWILEFEQQPIFGQPYTECPFDVEGCPPTNHAIYTTDQLYLYEKCLKSTDQRNSTVTKEGISSTEQTTEIHRQLISTASINRKMSLGTRRCEREVTECSKAVYIILIVLLAVLCVALPVIMAVCVFIRRRKRTKNKTKTHEPQNIHEQELLVGKDEPGSYDQDCNRACGSIESKGVRSRHGRYQSRHGRYQSNESIESKALVNPVDIDDSFIENDTSRAIKESFEKRYKEYENGKGKSIIIHGIRGSGKTCTAQHCLRSIQHQFSIIEASNENHLRKSLKDITEDYSLNDVDHTADLQNIIKVISEKLMKMKVALLIDDVINSQMIKLIRPMITKCTCIITTHDETIVQQFPSLPSFHVKGVTFKEAKQMFDQSDMQNFHSDDHLSQLVEALDGSPFGIKSVISYMKEKSLSVKCILKYLSHQEGEMDDRTPLFRVMSYHVNHIRSAYKEVSDLVFALQFLRCNDIPIYLFYVLASNKNDNCPSREEDHPYKKGEILTNDFVGVLRRMSFVDVQGLDEERRINVPKIVQYALSQNTDEPNKKVLYFKLLKCMSWLFLKDHGHQQDHKRCLDLLHHATELLTQYKSPTFGNAIDEALVYIQVCDQVRHTFEVLGYESQEKYYAKRMKEFVLRKILKKEEDRFLDDVTSKSADTLSNDLIKVIEHTVNENKEKISQLAEDYIHFKIRSKYDTENLKNEMKGRDFPTKSDEPSWGENLSNEEIAWLKERKLIINNHDNSLARIFVYEIIMSALTVFGQYALNHEDKLDGFRCFVNISKSLAKYPKLQHYVSVRTVGIELIGVKELRLRDHVQGTPGAFEDVQASIRDVERLRSDSRKYFKYGLYVLCPKENDDLQLRCHATLLEYHIACKEHVKSSEQAQILETLFLERFKDLKAAPHSQRVKQVLVNYLLENEEFERAKSILTACQHHMPSQTVSQYDCRDILLRFQCYERLNQFDEMRTLWNEVTFKFPRHADTAKLIENQIKEIKDKHLHEDC